MIKEFHVSENLWNEDYTNISSVTITYKPVYVGDGQFTLSTSARKTESENPSQNGNANIFLLSGNVSSGASTNGNGVWSTQPRTVTSDNGYVTMAYRYLVDDNGSNPQYNTTMLNKGSTPKPYEIYGNTWNTKSYAKSISGAQTYTKFPIVLRTTEQSIPTWSMDGNTETSGTPSPSSPITINGVGNKTAQLYNKSDTTTQYNAYLNANGTWVLDNSSRTVKLRCKGNTTYTISIAESSPIFRISEYSDYDLQAGDSSIILSSIIRGENLSQYTFTTSVDSECIIFQGSYSMYDSWLNSLMFVEGSPALPYEPYGYKIPIINGGVTTNIYLGSTQTTRQIKKLVLTGQESWTKAASATGVYYGNVLNNAYNQDLVLTTMCTHYIGQPNTSTVTLMEDMHCAVRSVQADTLYIRDTNIATREDWISYLQQHYANGTPVTVWYVLATPETVAVNEPLQKIGTYADTLSNATAIPTTSGLNTIDINTTLKPSEMSLTYDGYKICKEQKYQNNAWT